MSKKVQIKAISEKLITERLQFENPWWITGRTEEFYSVLKKRLYFESFHKLVEETDVRRAVVLMGPRRVGKTVMMQHSVQNLLENKVSPGKIVFINIENPIYNNRGLEELMRLALTASGGTSPGGYFIYFDEIQYLKNWEVHLKSLVDSYPHTKFIVSGSASAALKLKSAESGAGRFTEFHLPPLTFFEYISLKEYTNLIKPGPLSWQGNLTSYFTTPNIKEMNRYFLHYINFGGYPEVIFNEKIQSDPGRYIKNDIIDKVLLRDLPSLYGIQDVQELNSFFTTLAYNTGNEISLEGLSQSSGADKNLLKKYLEYLEAAFLIKVVNRVDDNSKKFKRVTFYKVYLTNPSLRSALFAPVDSNDELIGNIVETAVFSQLFHKPGFMPWYARWNQGRNNGEVDLLGLDPQRLKPSWIAEIKWSNRFFTNETSLKSLFYFMEKNNMKSALVTTLTETGVKEINGITIHFVPAALYALAAGAYNISL
ncbi:MAG: ATP-binding protein [Ignavibacteriaceae bacterium]|nr:ATP-binding protein [Ignavibacteriaceae bacterium]NUM69724.1 ATP-binding protein [Ignavibacteriaceae bacterium]